MSGDTRVLEVREDPAIRRHQIANRLTNVERRLFTYLAKHQTLHNERIRLPDLTVYLRTEPAVLEKRRAARAEAGDAYAATISADYLQSIHECYEKLAAGWPRTLRKYQEFAIVPPDTDLITLPAEIDMHDHPDYVHVAAGTIREKVRRMIAARKLTP